jgi:hypothetical protein
MRMSTILGLPLQLVFLALGISRRPESEQDARKSSGTGFTTLHFLPNLQMG